MRVVLKVNGAVKTLELDSRMMLLDALRERLVLTGMKKGFEQGQCGAGTVLVDGRPVRSCLTDIFDGLPLCNRQESVSPDSASLLLTRRHGWQPICREHHSSCDAR